MRPWAQWTAKTALLAAGFAAAAGGLSGVALAAGGSASSDASPGLSLGRLVAPAGVCDDTGVLLGVVGAACQVGTAVLPAAASVQTGPGPASTAPAGSGRSPAGSGQSPAGRGQSPTGPCGSGPLAGLQPMSGLAPLATAPAPRGLAGERVRRTSGNPPGASGAGDTTFRQHPSWPD